jgi:hypothetical protein
MDPGLGAGPEYDATPVVAGQALHPATDTLRARYDGYRRRQGRELLVLVPREGLRALLRAHSRELGAAPRSDPGLDALADFAASLVPLPPFDVWVEDFRDHRAAHLTQSDPPLADGPGAPAGDSVTIDVLTFSSGNEEWVAELQVRSVPEGWRGSIHFHRPGEAGAGCTGEVFREPHVTALRERFRGCDGGTFRAFLRSVLA